MEILNNEDSTLLNEIAQETIKEFDVKMIDMTGQSRYLSASCKLFDEYIALKYAHEKLVRYLKFKEQPTLKS